MRAVELLRHRYKDVRMEAMNVGAHRVAITGKLVLSKNRNYKQGSLFLPKT
jgi:hypothetical protein